MKKVLFALLAIVLLIAPISAFAEIDNNATITVALTTIIENEDYMIQGTLNGSGIFQMMFDELIDMNFDTAELIPGLATEWTISDDGCTWHFTLRDDVYFHDGEKLTAEDVKYTYDRMQMDDYNISNTNYLNNQILYDHIDIIDDYHFDFVTKDSSGALTKIKNIKEDGTLEDNASYTKSQVFFEISDLTGEETLFAFRRLEDTIGVLYYQSASGYLVSGGSGKPKAGSDENCDTAAS